MRADKQHKHQVALRRAMVYSPSHVMFLDSDDLVSNRLAEFVAAHSSENGWYMPSGYFFCEQQPYLHLEAPADFIGGSAHIVRPELLDFLPRWDDRLVFDHRQLARTMEERGTPLRPLPFRRCVHGLTRRKPQ